MLKKILYVVVLSTPATIYSIKNEIPENLHFPDIRCIIRVSQGTGPHKPPGGRCTLKIEYWGT